MDKYLLNTAISKEQTKLYARVEAMIAILEGEGILTEAKVSIKEEKIKQDMIEAGKKKN